MGEMVQKGVSRKIELAKAIKAGALYKSQAQDAHRAATYLSQSLGKLKGLPQKIGQILSLKEDPLNPGEFSKLTETGHDPLPFEAIQHIIESEFKKPLKTVFKDIEKKPIATASLSQVHKATTLSGEKVIVKVQYPEILSAIKSDLKALGWIGKPLKIIHKNFKLDEYQKVILETLDEELDYEKEFRNLSLFQLYSMSCPYLLTPKPQAELCTKKVLTLSHLTGDSFKEVCQIWTTKQKKILAENLIHFFFHSLLINRKLHADPHPGNYRFISQENKEKVSIVLYDFGCVKDIPQNTSLALKEIIEAVMQKRDFDGFTLLADMGFDRNQIEPISNNINAILKSLFSPFETSKDFSVASWNYSHEIEEFLGAKKWNLRTAGPASFIFIMRGFQGLFYYLKHLGVAVNWSQTVKPLIQSLYATKRIQDIQSNPSHSPLKLNIQVTENGNEKVRLYFKPECALRISEVMPDDVLEKLENKKIDIHEIEKSLNQKKSLTEQEIFSLCEGQKNIHVWLG